MTLNIRQNGTLIKKKERLDQLNDDDVWITIINKSKIIKQENNDWIEKKIDHHKFCKKPYDQYNI